MSKSEMTWKLKSAAWEFKSIRGQFYMDVASVMAASPGVPISKILGNYGDRYAKEAPGVLCRHWLERFNHVGTFTESVRGTIPDEDLTVLSASERAGDLRMGLEALGKNILGLQSCRSEITKTMISAFVLFLFAHVFVAINAFVVMPKLSAAMKGMVDVNNLGRIGSIFLGGSAIVRDWWWLWALFLVSLVALNVWALKHYVGRFRPWLDDNFLPFQMARDFNGSSFFVTVGSITGAMGAQVVQLHDALTQMKDGAYPWLAWQIARIQENMYLHPTSKGEIFDTGIANRKTYYRILDIADYSEVSVMLGKVGDIILKTAPEEIKARANTIRFILMAVCLCLMISIYGGTFALIEAFKAAAALKTLQ